MFEKVKKFLRDNGVWIGLWIIICGVGVVMYGMGYSGADVIRWLFDIK